MTWRCRLAAMLLFLPLLCGAAADDAPQTWWNRLWPYRVRIEAPASAGEVAQVDVILAGRSMSNARDLRLIDKDGRPSPFEIVAHDSMLQTTLALKVPDKQPTTLWLYFGNPRASKITTLQPDAREPAWRPRAGIVLRTYRKAEPEHPKTLPELLTMIAAAAQEGGAFVPNISQGHNLFGTSDQYMSVYEGSLRIERPGSYSFCSSSADGSWIRVNGKMVLEWPGPHGWGGSERGQHNGSIELPRGVASIEYYQEAGTGQQMAFMGWKPPGSDHFEAIPANQWVGVRQAQASEYESQKRSLLAVPQVQLLSTCWLPDTLATQVAMVRVSAEHSSTPAKRIMSAKWSFGDGQSAAGFNQRHVYFRLGRPTVQLTVTDSDGNTDTIACAPNIVLQDVQAADVHVGNAQEYARAAVNDDAQSFPREDLALYVEFWQRLERFKPFVAAASVYLQRFPDAPDAAAFARAAADACADPNKAFDPQLADQMFVTALAKISKDDAEAREELMLRRAWNLAWNMGKLEDAKQAYRLTIQSARSGRLGRDTVRNATIGLGDVALLGADPATAKDCYTRAEQMPAKHPATDQATELGKLGSYPWAVDDYLARGAYDEAADTLDEWENLFPLQKLEGTSLLLRGKLLFVRKPCESALKYLELAEVVNPQGTQVPEAVWLRANCLMELGKTSEAAAQFTRVMTDFTRSEFAAKATEKLAECQSKLKAGHN